MGTLPVIVGLDYSDRAVQVCVLDQEGKGGREMRAVTSTHAVARPALALHTTQDLRASHCYLWVKKPTKPCVDPSVGLSPLEESFRL
jgi:hypothetical protein